MAGMLQIITYLLCVYLIFKGIEIYQIANVKRDEKDERGLALGTVMIIISIIAAVIFALWINSQAQLLERGTRGLPSLYP